MCKKGKREKGNEPKESSTKKRLQIKVEKASENEEEKKYILIKRLALRFSDIFIFLFFCKRKRLVEVIFFFRLRM